MYTYIHNMDFKMDLVIPLFNCYELLNVYAHLKFCIYALHKPAKTLYTSNTYMYVYYNYCF